MDGKSDSAKLIEQIRDGEENPFHTIEGLGEHINMCWGILGKMGLNVLETDSKGRTVRPQGKPGEIVYHLRAIDEYQQAVFNAMAALLPDLYRWSEGDTAALNKFKQQLTELAERHQRAWEKI